MRKLNPAGLLAASATALLLLSGCTNAAPEPKPTTPAPTQAPTEEPEPEKLEAPTSADEAITEATAAVKEYMALRSEVFIDPSKIAVMEDVATGKALDHVQQEAAQVEEKGYVFSGATEFEFLRGAAGKLTTNSGEVEFGSVTVTGCYDLSGQEGLNKDGSTPQTSPVKRFEIAPLVVFDQAGGRWVVYQWDTPAEAVEC